MEALSGKGPALLTAASDPLAQVPPLLYAASTPLAPCPLLLLLQVVHWLRCPPRRVVHWPNAHSADCCNWSIGSGAPLLLYAA